MNAKREIVVYDGTRHIGTIVERDDRTCIARDVSGKKLGTFPNVAKAADAISKTDKIFADADRVANA
jgi:hypothetical protein